jgi:uncharacterized protein (DUF1015 family)
MAEIYPFKGILFNPDKISDFSDVVAPPYDVIAPEEQEQFYKRHPFNIIRLILGKVYATDTPENNCHSRAAGFLKKWMAEKILVQDIQPAYYLTAVDFDLTGNMTTRFGLIARVRIVPFEAGTILPHEKTFSKIKSERLELMKACHANLSPIFSLYTDKQDLFRPLKQDAVQRRPDMDLRDSNGFRHRLWRISDPEQLRFATEAMKGKTIFIADGHHRYETALNYLQWISTHTPGFSPSHPANYIMMSLSSVEDPGLVILPAHRLLLQVPKDRLQGLCETAEKFFRIYEFPFSPDNRKSITCNFINALKQNHQQNAIGVFIKGEPVFFLFVLKLGVMKNLFGNELPASLIELDVTVLTRLIFMELLGFDQDRLDNDRLIDYTSREDEAIDRVAEGKFDVAFLLNPTKIDQVQRIAREKLIMPRKSTYFFPKVISGQVINSLAPND